MKRFIIITIVFCTVCTGNAIAQSADHVLLFSRYYSGGTARSAGMSGAFGAVGGDLSVLNFNPAGLALYRGSELTITPGLAFTNTNAAYAGRIFSEKNTHFIINNIGYVYTQNLYNEKGLRSVNFGIAYNRLSDFYSDAYIKNQEASSSLLDEFVSYANGYGSDLDPFYEGLAYDLYAIDWDEENGTYYSDYDLKGNTYRQPMYRTMNTRGGIGEYDMSLGFNFNHKLFLGATLGVQDVFYKRYFFHEETPGYEYMDAFNFSEEYTINGMGLNFKAGIIYRPIQMLRLGAAIHTPTSLWLRAYSLTAMETVWNAQPTEDEYDTYLETESEFPDKFRIITPWRYNMSAAVVLGNFGMVDVDVEYVDYSGGSVLPNSIYDLENEDIATVLQSSVNMKAGTEIRLGPAYLRGGIAYYGNPYNKNVLNAEIRKTLTNTMSYSGGIGFRKRDFYMDAAYSYMKHPDRVYDLYMYDADLYEQATLQTNFSKLVLTFGFRF